MEEVYAAKRILAAAGLRREGPNLIACPTCGRTNIDLIPMAEEVERRLAGCKKPITVAVMGCAVNGPGEASAKGPRGLPPPPKQRTPPMPMADFSSPIDGVPASVIPRCSG